MEEQERVFESEAKALAGKEKREMEQILAREVKRDLKVNKERDEMLAQRPKKDEATIKGAEFVNGKTGIAREFPWEKKN